MNPEILLCIYLGRRYVDYLRVPYDESTTTYSFSTRQNGGIQGIVVTQNNPKYKVYTQDSEFETADLNSLNPYFMPTVILNQLPIYSSI